MVPVIYCGGGKWRIGNGKCIYKSLASAKKAYRGYLGAKYAGAITPRFISVLRRYLNAK